MTRLAYTRSGAGEPLVLLHGIGLSGLSWMPVLPELATRFDVLAVDLPGFGDSPALPPDREPTPAHLAVSVAGLLDALGIERPHLAGNSIGGWVALELAHIRPTASLTLLSPAGLWRRRTPLYDRVSLRATRWFAHGTPRLLGRLVGNRIGRYLVMRQSHGRPSRMTPEQARAAIRATGTCPAFMPTLRATAHRHYAASSVIDVPVTVSFGTKDAILLPWQSRHVDELPPQTIVANLPGCGHVPMTDDPVAVAALIRATATGTFTGRDAADVSA